MRKNVLTEKVLIKNSLNESATLSQDVSKFEPLITPLIKKIYPDTLVNQIANVQPLSSPIGKVSYLSSMYTGQGTKEQNNIFYNNSKIICFDVAAYDLFEIDGTGYTMTSSQGDIVFTVVYKEKGKIQNYFTDNSLNTTTTFNDVSILVISIRSGIFTPDAIFNSTYNILFSSLNRTAMKKILKDYSGPYNINNITNPTNEIGFQIATKVVETKSRKIISRFTLEQIQDIEKLYGEDYKEFVSDIIGNEIRQELDREVIGYLKEIARPMNDIKLRNSLGNQSGLFDLSNDIVNAIHFGVESIVRATKRNRTMFILCDSSTAAYLQINPWHTQAEPERDNPYYLGKIGSYPLYCDIFSDEHYILIGYRYDSDTAGDAGLIFAPYSHSIVDAKSLDPMLENLLTMNRYAYTRHPQDSGDGVGDSDFFRIFNIDYTGLSSHYDDTDGIPNLIDNMIPNN